MPWSDQETEEIAKAFAVACEVSGTDFSAPARAYMLAELQTYPAKLALAGLMRAPRIMQGRLTMAGVVRAIEFQDRKAVGELTAKQNAYLTTLRGCALVERIPWQQDNLPAVEAALTAKGYKCEKMPGYSSSKETRKILPHWTEPKEDEAEP